MSPKIVYDVTLPSSDSAPPDGIEFRDRAVLHCALLIDYAGNKFEGYSTLSGNDTAIIIRKYSLSDALLGEVTLHPPQGFKLDDFSLFPSDTNVLILAVAHEAISDPNRRNIGYRDVWPGVFVAYPSGHLPVDAATPLANWTRDVTPDPVPADVDYARIDRIVQLNVERGVTLLANQFGGGSIRVGIQEKVEDALVNLFTYRDVQPDPRVTTFQRVYSDMIYRIDGLYQRLLQTTFQVLRDNKMVEAAYKILGLPYPPPKP